MGNEVNLTPILCKEVLEAFFELPDPVPEQLVVEAELSVLSPERIALSLQLNEPIFKFGDPLQIRALRGRERCRVGGRIVTIDVLPWARENARSAAKKGVRDGDR